MTRLYTAEIYAQEGGFASVCPELVVASCGDTIEEARTMLVEAIELTLEEISAAEYELRISGKMSAQSDVSESDDLAKATLVATGQVEVNVDLPFVPAR